MRILLFGKNGQVGWELQRTLATLGSVIAYDFPEIDLSQPQSLPSLIRHVQPQAIVNAAAYTAVDRAESEVEAAFTVNRDAPAVMASEARAGGAAFIYYSTDYVFDGTKGSPYLESDVPNPLSVYGRSKLAGEQAVSEIGGAYLILRTSWVYSLRSDTFVNKVLRWARQNSTLRLAADQVGSPTWCRMLAEATAQVLAMAGDKGLAWLAERAGLYHLAGEGYASRFEWGGEILRLSQGRQGQTIAELLPARAAEFPAAAQRPLFSALNCDRFEQTFGLRLPPWKQALMLAMADFAH